MNTGICNDNEEHMSTINLDRIEVDGGLVGDGGGTPYCTLKARLAEATALLGQAAHDPYEAGPLTEAEWSQRWREFFGVTVSASAVQPERCCLDYPRCDCNSPPEPDNAPTLQPCGHPWEAQHDFKCILCSSPG